MDATTVNAIIASSAALVGAIVGAATSFGGGIIERRAEAKTQRENQKRAHSSSLASQCDELMRELTSLTILLHTSAASYPETRDKRDRKWNAFAELQMLAIGLPRNWRDRIQKYIECAHHVDEIGSDGHGEGHHYESVRRLATEIAREAHGTLVALARGEEKLPQESDLMIEIQWALRDCMEVREYEYAPEESERQNERTRWLKKHPSAVKDLNAKKRTSS